MIHAWQQTQEMEPVTQRKYCKIEKGHDKHLNISNKNKKSITKNFLGKPLKQNF